MARVSIEDCLQFLENRFALVTVAADRARQLMQGEDALLRTKNKEAVTALREIADGLVVKKEFRAAPVVEHESNGSAEEVPAAPVEMS